MTSAASAGCHRLIREFDAICVTNAAEMAELAPLQALVDTPPSASSDEPSSTQVRVFDAMSTRSARPIGDIAARAGLSVASVQAILGEAELGGLAAERERGWVRRHP